MITTNEEYKGLWKILCWDGQKFATTTESWYDQQDASRVALKEQALYPNLEFFVVTEHRAKEFVLQ